MLTKKQTITTAAMAILASVAALNVPTTVQAEDIHHTVKQGEYLYNIAPKYGSTVDQLIEWNQLDNINLQIGDTLIVSKDESDSTNIETPETPQEENQTDSNDSPTDLPSPSYYGYGSNVKLVPLFFDSLQEAIDHAVSNFDYRQHEDYYVNSYNYSDYGFGYVLYFEFKDVVTEVPVPSESETPADSDTYTVQAGDSLYRIANKFGITIEDLIKANPYASTMIHPGDKLVIPTTNGETPPDETEEEPTNPGEGSQEQTFYIVQAGDYLYLIANKFGITVDELKAANNMDSNMIHPGNRLVIPKENGETPPDNNDEEPTTPDEGSTEETIYTVKAGDSLYHIANKFGVSIEDLVKANPYASTMIHPGDKLVISTTNGETPPDETEEEPTNPDEDSEEQTFYTVQAGDYLYLIANKFGITVDELKAANNMNSNMIHPGVKLVIPTENGETQPDDNEEETTTPDEGSTKETIYTVQAGDSLYRISRKYNITVDELIKANPLAGTMIHPGDRLVIPTIPKVEEGAGEAVIETEPTAIDNFLLDKKVFQNITSAVEYGRKVFDDSKYNEFYVEYVNGNYRVFWELN